MKRHLALAAFTLLLGLAQISLLCGQANAGLGDPESHIENDRHAVSGVMRGEPEKHPAYTVYVIKTTGREMREYVTKDGTIFGIAWQGINHPDLEPLMGTFYKEFREVSKQTGRTRVRLSHGTIRSANTVVETAGHLREMRGRAYVQSLLPEGVNADEIH